MSETSGPIERANQRRAILRLASVLLLLILVLGLLALFSVWSLGREHERNLAELASQARAVDEGREAQVHFKVQVQEWKNILLRGGDKQDFEHYSAALESERASVQHHLAQLQTQLRPLGLTRVQAGVDALLREHQAVSEKYRQQVDALRESVATADMADGLLRGVDRSLNEAMDAFAVGRMQAMEQRIKAQADAEQRRYAILTRALWVVLGVSALLLFLGVWRMIGGSRAEAT